LKKLVLPLPLSNQASFKTLTSFGECFLLPKKRGLVFLIGNQSRQLIRNSDDYDVKWVSG